MINFIPKLLSNVCTVFKPKKWRVFMIRRNVIYSLRQRQYREELLTDSLLVLAVYKPNYDRYWSTSMIWFIQGSGVQVKESVPSCFYVALAGRKSADFPQSEEQPICNQLVCFITIALKLLSTPSYITLGLFLIAAQMAHLLAQHIWSVTPLYTFLG